MNTNSAEQRRTQQLKRAAARARIEAQALDLATPRRQLVNHLCTAAYTLAPRTKRGELYTVAMVTASAATIIARSERQAPYTVLTKRRMGTEWPKNAQVLVEGPLWGCINAANEFMRKHGNDAGGRTGWAERPATQPQSELLEAFGIIEPSYCTRGTASALISAHQFSRTYAALKGERMKINGREARPITASELEGSI